MLIRYDRWVRPRAQLSYSRDSAMAQSKELIPCVKPGDFVAGVTVIGGIVSYGVACSQEISMNVTVVKVKPLSAESV